MQLNPTVLTGRNNIFTVREPGGETVLCRLKGKTLELEERAYNPLAPGDEVVLSDIDRSNATAVISARLPRRTSFERYNNKRAALQTLAANIDLVVVVMSASDPEFRHRFVDRILLLAEHHRIPSLLAITKSDLDPGEATRHAECYERIEYPALLLRTDLPESLDALRTEISGRRTVFVGQSGVGKSTLVNGLVGSDLQEIGAISGKFHRGRHTTNAAVLIQHDNIEIVDTPGIREVDCRHVPLDELGHGFREFRPFLGSCGLTDCTHTHEPECAVRTAVETGTLDRDRYESYIRLFKELVDLQEDAL